MKRFLLQIIFYFAIPVGVLLVYCEHILRQIPNDYQYKNEWLLTNAKDVQVYILGSSHSYFGIDPKVFSVPAFNGGHISQSLNLDYFLLQKFSPAMDSLKCVIIPFGYGTIFSDGLEKGKESWRVRNYTIYYDCPYFKHDPKLSYECLNTKPNEIKEAFKGGVDHIYCDSLGMGTNYALENRSDDWKASGETAAKRHTHYSEANKQKNIEYLEKMIEICSAKNARLILVATPTYSSYRENLDSLQLAESIQVGVDLAEKHDNVIYYNWADREDFIEDDFFDADHLNEYGAKKLGLLLDSVIHSY